jgi:hyperosmotically inducible protein
MNLLKQTTALLVVTLVLGTAGCGKSSHDGTKSSNDGTKSSNHGTQSSNDAAITSRVKTAISKEPGLKGTKVSVSTDQKVVHLSGTVKSRAERAQLIAVARKVEGVKAVKTDLEVKQQQKPRVEARGKKREPRAQYRVTRGEVIPGTGR